MIVRSLEKEDIPAARRFWHDCFPEDSEAFLDWFFTKRFTPSLSAGCFEEGILLSVMHGTLMPLTCGEKIMPALMVSGVSTKQEVRGRGYMHSAMLFLKDQAAAQGIPILFNHPQEMNAYKRLGYLPCTKTLYLDEPASYFDLYPDTKLREDTFSEKDALAIYREQAKKYQAFSVRDASAFAFRAEEMRLDGGEAHLFYSGNIPSAYCFCHREGDITVCDEILSCSYYGPVLAQICRITHCTRIRAKLPPDTSLPGKIKVQNIMLAEPQVYSSFGFGTTNCYSVDEY